MNCNGVFNFRGIEKREGGSFTNSEGKVIDYKPSYVVFVDEDVNGKIFERKFKFPIENEALYRKFSELDIYDKIEVYFDINFIGTSVRLVPYDVSIN